MRRLRGALIGIVVLVYGFTAAPLPRHVSRSLFKNPVAREELSRWSEVAAGAGVEVTPRELAELAYDVGRAVARFRTAVVDPFRPWYRYTGTGQGWGLFAYPDSHPFRLVIEGRATGGPWRALFLPWGESEGVWGAQLRYRRLRAVYDTLAHRKDPGEMMERFADAAAAAAFARDPSLETVRVRFERLHSPRPGEAPRHGPVEGFTGTRRRGAP